MGIFFGTDGIRGVVNEDLNFDIAYRCGNALASEGKKIKIIIGRDTRVSGSYLTLAFAVGAMNGGADVVDIGVGLGVGVGRGVAGVAGAGGQLRLLDGRQTATAGECCGGDGRLCLHEPLQGGSAAGPCQYAGLVSHADGRRAHHRHAGRRCYQDPLSGGLRL